MTVQVRDAHRQITTTLIFQAIIPCVVSLIPVITAVTMAVIHANIPTLGFILAMLYTIIPVANPLLTLIVIRNYRRNVLLMVGKLCGKWNTQVGPMTTSEMLQPTPPDAKGISTSDRIEQIA